MEKSLESTESPLLSTLQTGKGEEDFPLNTIQKATLVVDHFVQLPGVILNFILVILILRCKKLRTVTYGMIATLAMLDNYAALCLYWMRVVGYFVRGTEHEWLVSNEFTIITLTFYGYNVLNIVAMISINRYLCIVRPNTYKRVFTVRNTLAMASIGIIISVSALATLGETFFRGAQHYNFDLMQWEIDYSQPDFVRSMSVFCRGVKSPRNLSECVFAGCDQHHVYNSTSVCLLRNIMFTTPLLCAC